MPDTAVTIFLPTYEPHADFLRAALDSVTTQTEERWTLSINDDTSTMNVRAIIEPYLKDPRISFSRNPHRLGIGGNWNICLGGALGAEPGPSYIQFLFQDDIWDFGYLERALRIMEEHPTVGFVSLEHDYDCEVGTTTAPLYEELRSFRQEHIAPSLHQGKELLTWWLERGLHPNIIGEPSFVMLRRSIVEKIGFFECHMQQNLDVDYWTRMLEVTDWYYGAENGGTFRVHRGGASERNRREGRGLFDRLLTIERVLRRSGKSRKEQGDTLTHHATEMFRKFRTQKSSKQRNFSDIRPFLGFVLRHPIVVYKAAMHVL